MRLRRDVAAGAAVLIVAVTGFVAAFLVSAWTSSLNELSVVLYTGCMYTAPIVTFYGCWTESQQRNVLRRSPWLTSPRPWAVLIARSLASRYFLGVAAPLLLVQLSVIALGLLAGAKGFWDPRYALLGHGLFLVLFLLGVVIGYLRLSPTIRCVVAVFIGLFCASLASYTDEREAAVVSGPIDSGIHTRGCLLDAHDPCHRDGDQ
ncbi:hypothetical protein [Corynebacterium cystitidis]|uniref:Uncharacterized protein n=1 Tax=Corynebacterium cystitidis DSM 20524 TaxID=1121357 RepID=A0A1H9VT53_9CORY|nr:hypothetical protein [Corynebacterium cystitidis]WJY81088.1 hypothetical protein CCYS_00520 [Corynebacterium cystitidis DSM 20524]SES24855.1 hypothetical protein SAMN05661109_02375 [Corynebacterium cystitidis DSM 20524]SNV90070.1 Uncharacterised protein [Corynebacterium cystitidis]